MNFMELLVAKDSPLDNPRPEFWCLKCKDAGWTRVQNGDGTADIVVCTCPAGDEIREEAEL